MKPLSRYAAALAITAALASSNVCAADPKFIAYPAGAEIGASFKLLPPVGKVGRENPFYNNYRPQVQFSGEKARVTCAVRLPDADGKVEPGQTAEVKLVCGDGVRVLEDRKAFAVFEGGRLVGEGQVR